MARRSDHTKEELKDLILNTAINIVKKDGFQKLTARKLAQKIDYTPGTIYNFYGSMDGVYFAINAETLQQLSQKLTACSEQTDKSDITQNVKNISRAYMDFAHEQKELWLMIFNQPLSHDEKAPDWYKELAKNQFSPLEKILSPLFSDKKHQEKEKAARAIWSAVHGLCLMKETEKMTLISNEDAFKIAEYFIDNFIAGIEQSAN